MTRSCRLPLLALLALGSACAGAAKQAAPPPATPARSTVPNPADIHFMSGMIPHHAQAVVMAGWAPSHGARADVATLCERIVVGQRDEIALMQAWLRDHHQEVPPANSMRMHMTMNGMTHDMLMPGMLSDAEM